MPHARGTGVHRCGQISQWFSLRQLRIKYEQAFTHAGKMRITPLSFDTADRGKSCVIEQFVLLGIAVGKHRLNHWEGLEQHEPYGCWKDSITLQFWSSSRVLEHIPNFITVSVLLVIRADPFQTICWKLRDWAVRSFDFFQLFSFRCFGVNVKMKRHFLFFPGICLYFSTAGTR